MFTLGDDAMTRTYAQRRCTGSSVRAYTMCYNDSLLSLGFFSNGFSPSSVFFSFSSRPVGNNIFILSRSASIGVVSFRSAATSSGGNTLIVVARELNEA